METMLVPLPPPPKPRLHTTRHHHLLAAATTVAHLKQLHNHLLKSTATVTLHPTFFSKLLSLPLTTPSSLHYALVVFLHVQTPSTSLCNRLLRCLSRSYDPRLALEAYRHMRLEGLAFDRFSFPPLLRASARCRGEEGREIHGVLEKGGFGSDPFVQTGLVRCYAARGSADDARKMFDHMIQRDVVAWGVMLDGYCQSGRYEDVIMLFDEMREASDACPDQVVLVSVLSACARVGNLNAGSEVHSYISANSIEVDDHLQAALINMYASCGSMDLAQKLYDEMSRPKNLVASTALVFGYAKTGKIDVARVIFDEMPEKDLVSWSAMISGCAECERHNEALVLFNEMLTAGVKPDRIVTLSVISSCGHLGALDHAKWLDIFVGRNGFREHVSVGNALIDMYSKCGRLEMAWRVFDRMREKNVISWTSMITGLAMHGAGGAALRLFDSMKADGIVPNEVTFISLLYGCAHSGLIEDGRRIFESMVHEHNIPPKLEHYGCMVDILGRGKLLHEALKLIDTMPMRPNVIVWGSLLGAARVHGDVETGEIAARKLLEIDPCHDGAHVLLSNIYAKANRWGDVGELRRRMKNKGLLKERGCSWIEQGGLVHEFAVGDKTHPRSSEIYAKLGEVVKKLKMAGYTPNTTSVLVDLEEEEEKVEVILSHSEKLALSFGLINSVEGSRIHIAKNLRVCDDCHSFMKLSSLVYSVEIVLRDRTRFHHFKDGICSCKDFW